MKRREDDDEGNGRRAQERNGNVEEKGGEREDRGKGRETNTTADVHSGDGQAFVWRMQARLRSASPSASS